MRMGGIIDCIPPYVVIIAFCSELILADPGIKDLLALSTLFFSSRFTTQFDAKD